VRISILLPPSLGALRATARAEVLAEWMQRKLGIETEVRVASSYDVLAAALLDAQVDLAWAPPSICAQVEPHVPAIFTAVRGGRSSYCAAIVARAGRFTAVEQLRGTIAAWVEPRSSGGHLLAAAMLRAHGLDLGRDLADQSFYGSYRDAVRAVIARRADFTSVFTPSPDVASLRRPLQDLVGAAAAELDAVAFTASAPSDGLVVTRRLMSPGPRGVVPWLAPLIDGRDPGSYLLLLLEAERLVRASPNDYAALG
jgi:ABC-type phosphate/phosphonate transport system substrate-binding protein